MSAVDNGNGATSVTCVSGSVHLNAEDDVNVEAASKGEEAGDITVVVVNNGETSRLLPSSMKKAKDYGRASSNHGILVT